MKKEVLKILIITKKEVLKILNIHIKVIWVCKW